MPITPTLKSAIVPNAHPFLRGTQHDSSGETQPSVLCRHYRTSWSVFRFHCKTRSEIPLLVFASSAPRLLRGFVSGTLSSSLLGSSLEASPPPVRSTSAVSGASLSSSSSALPLPSWSPSWSPSRPFAFPETPFFDAARLFAVAILPFVASVPLLSLV